MCDTANDCGDNSDEAGCPKTCDAVCAAGVFPRTVFDNGVCRPCAADAYKRFWPLGVMNYL